MGKGDRVKQSTGRSKKRRFYGNQFSKVSGSSMDSSVASHSVLSLNSTSEDSISHAKVLNIDSSTPLKQKGKVKVSGYRFMDVEILSVVFESLCCPDCKTSRLTLKENIIQKKGLAILFQVTCKCGYKKEFYNSKYCGKAYDVNRRIIYTMRSCGHGYRGVEKFTALMDMPKPMAQKSYDEAVKNMMNAAKSVALDTMNDAVNDIKRLTSSNDDRLYDASVSCDGSWQKRGYSSLNGVVTAITMDTGKIIDCEAMSRICKECNLKKPLKLSNPSAYDEWKMTHECCLNYHGSAPGMELVGTKRIFARSIEKHEMRYVNLYGDGDTKSYSAVKDIYPGLKVKKLECVGHVQKHVGTRLRNLKKNVKGLGGKGKLTNTIIDRFQNYYGIAIRSNVGDLEGMKKAIYASLFHVASSHKNNYHTHCPTGKNSWCKFNKDEACYTNSYKAGAGLPLEVIAKLKPIYKDLSSTDLLAKCLHGKTQNQNESFNAMIWERLPKTKYVSNTQLQLGVYDAVANFNIGRKASVLIYEKLNMIPGRHTLKGCANINKRRLDQARYKTKNTVKVHRKILRASKKSKEDTDVENEGTTYEAGGF